MTHLHFANDDEAGAGATPALGRRPVPHSVPPSVPPGMPRRGRRWRRRWGRTLAVLGAVAFLAGACGESTSDYFPLTPGWTWSYRVTTEIKSEGRNTARSFWFSLPPQRIGDKTVMPRIMHDGRIYYYAARSDGIHWVGYRSPGETAFGPKVDRFVLKYPLKKGTGWQTESRTYLLKKQVISPEDVSVHNVRAKVQIDYTIEKLDDTVTVPAGTFRHSLKVRGTGTTTFELGGRAGIVPIQVETLKWYAPGVGLVKMVRRETSRPGNLIAGEMVMELEFVDKGSWLD